MRPQASSSLFNPATPAATRHSRLLVDAFATAVTPTYDAAGNMLSDGLYTYTYDAWNRLLTVSRSGDTPQLVATYRYDGLGRRVYKKVEHSGDLDRTEYFYYNSNWQLLEIAGGDNKARQQFVWGTQYIDEAICMDVDTDSDGDCTDLADSPAGARRFFYCQDANWNVTALLEATASGVKVRERYEYDPYGTVRLYKGSPASGTAELRQVTGSSLSWLDTTLPGNPILYAGYYHDSETTKYHVRNRMLDLDRWMQRDPAEYVDGMNSYQYVGSRPVSATDSLGMWGEGVHYGGAPGTLEWADSVGYTLLCATTIATADNDVDRYFGGKDPLPYVGDMSYHFDTDRNGDVVVPGARQKHVDHYLGIAKKHADSASNRSMVLLALVELGTALHPLQDMFSHNATHNATMPKYHSPSVYCGLGLESSAWCKQQEKTNPNWQDPHRPDIVWQWVDDHQATERRTKSILKEFLEYPSVECYCAKR